MTSKTQNSLKAFRAEMRRIVARYVRSEGCSCCEGMDHTEHREVLAKALNVPKYSDGSGYDFGKYHD